MSEADGTGGTRRGRASRRPDRHGEQEGLTVGYLWSMARARSRLDRRGRRTFVAVAVATYGLLLCFASINAMGTMMTSSAREIISGDLSVFADGYTYSMLNPQSETVRLVPEAGALAADLAATPGVDDVRSRITVSARLESQTQEAAALVVGADVGAEGYEMLSGDPPSGPGEVCLTETLVDELDVEVGEAVRFSVAGAPAETASVTGTVSCVYDTTRFGLFRTTHAVMELTALQQLLDRPDAVTQLLVDLEDPEQTAAVESRLSERLATQDVHLEQASTTAGLIYSIRTAQQAVMWALVAVTAVICAVLVGNIVKFSLLRERREFATMRAMGFSPRRLRMLSMLQTLGRGSVMVAAGTAAALLTTWICAAVGIPIGGGAQLFGDTTLTPSLGAWEVVLTAGLMTGALVVADLTSTASMLRRSPLEMLRTR